LDVYKKARGEFLQSFIEGKPVFGTAHFSAVLGGQVRQMFPWARVLELESLFPVRGGNLSFLNRRWVIAAVKLLRCFPH
jgi:hypothetical protein